MFEKMSRLKTLIDEYTRQTEPLNRVMHEFLGLSREACKEIERQEKEAEKAWADGDTMAWRDYAKHAMQSLIVTTGTKLDDSGSIVPGFSSMEPDKAFECIAKAAKRYADAMVVLDRDKRKGAEGA